MSQELKNPHFPNEEVALKLNLAVKGTRVQKLGVISFRPLRSMLRTKSMRPSTGLKKTK